VSKYNPINQHTTETTLPAPQYVIRYRGYAVQFVQNARGKVWQMVGDKDATKFSRPIDALVQAQEYGLQTKMITVEPVPN
jgi:hypothetical protein